MCGNIVSTVKTEGFGGHALLLVIDVQPDRPDEATAQRGAAEDPRHQQPYVAVDLVGAGVGEVVLVTRGSGARIGGGSGAIPTDAAIVAIVDSVRMNGSTTFNKQ